VDDAAAHLALPLAQDHQPVLAVEHGVLGCVAAAHLQHAKLRLLEVLADLLQVRLDQLALIAGVDDELPQRHLLEVRRLWHPVTTS
jgi:hypothetical protein